MTVRKTFAREYIDRGRWLWSVSTCTADANDRIIRCGRTGVPVRTAASFQRNYRRLHDAWGTRVTNEHIGGSDPNRSSHPARFPARSIPLKFTFTCLLFVEIIHHRRLVTRRRMTSSSRSAREHYVDATAKVGPPLTEKLFISKSTREETAVGTASSVGCIMQRLFEVRLSFFSHRLALLFLLFLLSYRLSLFSLLFTLFRREAARHPRLHR